MLSHALTFEDKRKAVFNAREIPGLSDGEAIIENMYSLISPGTELALYTGSHIGFSDPEITWARYPIDSGYASVGRVVESASDLLPLNKIVMHYGTHASHTRISREGPIWAIVPDGLDPQEACFGRFAQIAYSSVAAAARPCRKVLVYGAGIVGNLAAQWFNSTTSATAVIRDLSAVRIQKAEECGLSADSAEMNENCPDTIVEATGSPQVVINALSTVAPFGQVILLGSTRGSVDINVYKLIHRKALILAGAHETILADKASSVLAESLLNIKSGMLQVKPLITHVIAPDELPVIYNELETKPDVYLGVFVDWSKWNE